MITNNVINMEFNMKEFFPHDGGARRDPKVVALLMKYGIKGYGIFIMILEVIFEGKLYKIKEQDIAAMAFDIRIEENELIGIMEYLSSEKCGLMIKKDDFYFSKRMNDTMDNIKRISRINRANVRKRYSKKNLEDTKQANNGSTTVEQSNNNGNTTVTQEEKRREEKRIRENKIEDNSIIIPKKTKQEQLAYRELEFRKFAYEYNESKNYKYADSMIEEFLSYYTEPNKSQTKMKYETFKTWEIGRRLGTWYRNSKKFNKQTVKESNQEAFREFANDE